MDDLDELIAMYEEGAYPQLGFYSRATFFVPELEVQAIIDRLPNELRDGFVQWLRTTFDNDIPIEDFILIGDTGDPEDSNIRIGALRSWLRANPARPAHPASESAGPS